MKYCGAVTDPQFYKAQREHCHEYVDGRLFFWGETGFEIVSNYPRIYSDEVPMADNNKKYYFRIRGYWNI